MPQSPFDPPLDQFLTTAQTVARERPEVDPDLVREVFEEAATLVHNGLVLDGLDEHDAHLVVAGLCEDLSAPDPGAALRSRTGNVLSEPEGLHNPRGVAAAYEIATRVLQL